jgi:hypothetical protein
VQCARLQVVQAAALLLAASIDIAYSITDSAVLYSLLPLLSYVQSFTETQHPLDVYETITVVQSFADYFAGTKTGPTITDGTLDACRPAGYEFTGAGTSNSCTLTLCILLFVLQ